MKFILDFDGVILNTEALKELFAEAGIAGDERSPAALERFSEHRPDVDLKDLVFPNALEFITKNAADVYIVSTATSSNDELNVDQERAVEFQWEKLRRAGILDIIPPVRIRVVPKSKREALCELQLTLAGEQLLFVDDRQVYLREAESLGIETVWMDRSVSGPTSYESGSERYRGLRVESFDTLKELITSWKENK